MTRRPFPVAAGLVMLYVGVVQATSLLPMLGDAVAIAFGKEIGVLALGVVLFTAGQIGMGYRAAAERPVALFAAVFGAGCVVVLYGLTLLDMTNITTISVALLQLVGGPLVLAVVARSVPASRTPARREIGALLLVMGVAGAFASAWSFLSTAHLFGIASMQATTMLGLGFSLLSGLLLAGLAVRAGLQLLAGRATARRALAQWMWISIAGRVLLALLTVASFWSMDFDASLHVILQPLGVAALACVMPLALGRLGRAALAAPIDRQDARSVPTVYAWSALWGVPMLLGAAVVARLAFVTGTIFTPGAGIGQPAVVSALCGVAAALLLATALAVLRTLPFARLVVRVTAALAVGVMCYVVYLAWPGDPRDVHSIIPLGTIALFTTAMLALAWFEARREHDLAPARVV